MKHTRIGKAVWNGSGLEGSGSLSTPRSGAFTDLPYSTKMRFENEDGTAGTNPEELIAAAHAGCFNMALSFQLSGAGHPPEELKTQAKLTIEKDPDGSGWTITAVELNLEATVPGMDEATFHEKAKAAKEGCPVSRLLNADITLNATLN
jgi:osmotically inducible protein OsmC